MYFQFPNIWLVQQLKYTYNYLQGVIIPLVILNMETILIFPIKCLQCGKTFLELTFECKSSISLILYIKTKPWSCLICLHINLNVEKIIPRL